MGLWQWSLAFTTRLSRNRQRHHMLSPPAAGAGPALVMSLGLAPAIMPTQTVFNSADLAQPLASIVTTRATLRIGFCHQQGAGGRKRTISDRPPPLDPGPRNLSCALPQGV